ncbi:ras-related protein rab-5c [Anaeramoeba flamelloides]|uniref:Ras-related protein rab-5c n=1 Tax=Anaeramoeba flamelloides TaxID=1746091 RepID=A0AAV8A0L1_9EUKA|nr:ras-related protein rab-5c [Anaeramoeba flamelloides]KAJ6250429.1 ras-related protein rab-5c [Anaeramoeba flamelloides]
MTVNHKIVFLGESSVGKSSLVIRFVKRKFSPYQEPTIGAAFLSKKLTHNNVHFKLQIWDTAGQERYHSLAPMYYRGSSAAFVIYDVTQKVTFEKSKKWIDELKKLGDPNVQIAFVANKIDLAENQKVSREIGQNFADENGLTFFETSAKTGKNVDKLFLQMLDKLPKNNSKNKKMGSQDSSGSDKETVIALKEEENTSQTSGGCC